MKDLPNERAFTETPRTRELETITFCVLSELLGRKCSMARKICGIEAGEEIWSERIQAAVSEVHALFSLGFYNLRMESLWEEKDDSPISEGNFFLSALEDHETWKHLAPCQDEERMARFRENVFRKIRIVEI